MLPDMELRKVSGCDDDECPAVYLSDLGTAVVRGDQVPIRDGPTLSSGEAAVELPVETVLHAVAALSGSAALRPGEDSGRY
ncbi:hypothetical protein SAMN04487820_101318 [Actinopolyspora mzabensis]|uniref:Uncharacterized protein n=1 Tax=Actinopolyspora mzabensis TaxID=995066 RepID=A0A1G8VTJ2_ACTMZ|nr:hypothetical protein SAMN04487820_101318 [Actinopolyspora mzabensis]